MVSGTPQPPLGCFMALLHAFMIFHALFHVLLLLPCPAPKLHHTVSLRRACTQPSGRSLPLPPLAIAPEKFFKKSPAMDIDGLTALVPICSNGINGCGQVPCFTMESMMNNPRQRNMDKCGHVGRGWAWMGGDCSTLPFRPTRHFAVSSCVQPSAIGMVLVWNSRFWKFSGRSMKRSHFQGKFPSRSRRSTPLITRWRRHAELADVSP